MKKWSVTVPQGERIELLFFRFPRFVLRGYLTWRSLEAFRLILRWKWVLVVVLGSSLKKGWVLCLDCVLVRTHSAYFWSSMEWELQPMLLVFRF